MYIRIVDMGNTVIEYYKNIIDKSKVLCVLLRLLYFV